MAKNTFYKELATDRAYRRAEGVVLRKAAGESLLIPVRGRIAELQNLFVLDGTGEVIWNSLAEPLSLNTLAQDLATRFAQPIERVRADCHEFLNELLAEGLVCPV